jgi:hypothetical protein
MYKKNLTRAAVISYILLFAIVFTSYAIVLKKAHNDEINEVDRLLVVEDLSTDVIIPDVEDPYKPKVEENLVAGDNTTDDSRQSVPVKTTKTKTHTTKTRKTKTSINYNVPRPDSVDYTRTLDSLQNISSGKDTTGKYTNIGTFNNYGIPDSLIYRIPDSLKASVDDTAFAIRIKAFPREWKFQSVDNKSFYFYFGTDTVTSRGDSITIYLYLNSKESEDKVENYTKDFKLTDSLNVNLIAKCQDSKPDAGTDKIVYRYIILGKVDRLNIKASVHKKYLENNINLSRTIEAIVRSISFRKPN